MASIGRRGRRRRAPALGRAGRRRRDLGDRHSPTDRDARRRRRQVAGHRGRAEHDRRAEGRRQQGKGADRRGRRAARPRTIRARRRPRSRRSRRAGTAGIDVGARSGRPAPAGGATVGRPRASAAQRFHSSGDSTGSPSLPSPSTERRNGQTTRSSATGDRHRPDIDDPVVGGRGVDGACRHVRRCLERVRRHRRRRVRERRLGRPAASSRRLGAAVCVVCHRRVRLRRASNGAESSTFRALPWQAGRC